MQMMSRHILLLALSICIFVPRAADGHQVAVDDPDMPPMQQTAAVVSSKVQRWIPAGKTTKMNTDVDYVTSRFLVEDLSEEEKREKNGEREVRSDMYGISEFVVKSKVNELIGQFMQPPDELCEYFQQTDFTRRFEMAGGAEVNSDQYVFNKQKLNMYGHFMRENDYACKNAVRQGLSAVDGQALPALDRLLAAFLEYWEPRKVHLLAYVEGTLPTEEELASVPLDDPRSASMKCPRVASDFIMNMIREILAARHTIRLFLIGLYGGAEIDGSCKSYQQAIHDNIDSIQNPPCKSVHPYIAAVQYACGDTEYLEPEYDERDDPDMAVLQDYVRSAVELNEA